MRRANANTCHYASPGARTLCPRVALACWVYLYVPALAQPVVSPDVKLSSPYGPDGTDDLDIPGCLEFPVPPGTEGCDKCLQVSTGGTPPADWAVCDDDPKHQREPSIAAAWWDPEVLIGVFMGAPCRSRAGR